ncbi:hypothetical protein ABI59_06090 [Acidobacteria bacterium Mor1]|nr:hypothetical protein ABI59_06090 [Acidobacteria bacterium Mor1]
MDRPALEAWSEAREQPRFRAGQIYRWMYGRQRLDPNEWTDLPGALRERIVAEHVVETGQLAERLEASDGTIKYRVELPGSGSVESVYMVQDERVTLCISSQVGCALGCDFCMTARMGLVRHLTAGEILGQAAMIRDDRGLHERPFNIVFMGMGEPLHNYDAVLSAVRTLTDPEGFGLSRKRITVSTVGLVPAIDKLAAEPVRPRLAVSLNATTDEQRDALMPVNRRYPLAVLRESLRRYAQHTGDTFTFEYVMLAGVNDSDDDVRRLARLAHGLPVKINLIPFNEVPGELPYRSPSRDRVFAVRDALLGRNVRTSIRWSRGADARAACGQLALESGKHKPKREASS